MTSNENKTASFGTENMPRSLIQVARATLLGLVVFAAYYPYKLLTTFVPFAFSGAASWQPHWMVDDAALVPFWGRLAQFGLWVPTMVATQIMILLAIYLVWLFQREVLFEHTTIRVLKWLGSSAALAAVFALIAFAFDAWWLTSWNTELPRRAIQFHFESGEMGVLLCGLGLFLLGHVLEIAAFKQNENEDII